MLDRRPVLCVVAGPNGSGKTSATIQLLSNEWAADALYINPDNIAQETFGDWNSPTAILKAAQVATEERYRCLAEKKDFVFETVLSSEENIIGKTKSTIWKNEKYIFTDFRLFVSRLFDSRLIAAQTPFDGYKINPSDIFVSEGFSLR